jgi:actin-related protein
MFRFPSANVKFPHSGYALPHAFTRVQLGGQHISQHLYDLVVASNPTVALNYDLNDIEYQIKEKRHCFVALDQVIERQKVKEAEPTVVELTRDNGVVDKITLTSELFDACELLFDTSLFLNTSTKASERPLPQCIVDTIMSCDIDIRKDLSRNITLAGGGALLRNLAARLQQELQTLSPALEWRVVCPQEAKYSSWIGGSILGSLSTFSKMWISRVEYDEAGTCYPGARSLDST